MNNKGQSLVLFIILLPIVTLLIALLLEQIHLNYEKTKISNILNLACDYENKEEFIKMNDKSIEIEIRQENNKTIIITKKVSNTILNKVLGSDRNTIKNKKICEVD